METKFEFLFTGKSIVQISWNGPDRSILIISGIFVPSYILCDCWKEFIRTGAVPDYPIVHSLYK